MSRPGKSQPPQPLRDSRVDDSAPVPIKEDVRRQSSKSMRIARDVRHEADEAEADVARLKAERASDMDDIAAMLVKLADMERARDAADRRASGLEAWTLELEAKVAEARTRADELETGSAELRQQLEAARADVRTVSARVGALQVELAGARRDAEDAVELERVKRGLEIDTLTSQHASALAAARAEHSASGGDAVREVLAKVLSAIDELDRHETAASATRARLVEEARIALSNDHVTAPPPALEVAPAMARPTLPPARPAKKKSRRPSAPPRPVPASLTPITKPSDQLETFADLLDLGD